MAPPTLWQHTRQVLGRALRETGQALDRLAIRTASLAVTPHDYYDDPVIFEDFLSRHRSHMPLLYSGRPVVHPSVAYVAPCATMIGSVRVGKGSSIWYGAVLRADACENAESYRKSDAEILAFVEKSMNDDSEERIRLSRVEEEATDKEEDNTSSELLLQPLDEQPTEEFTLEEDRYDQRLDRHGGGIFIGENTNVQDGAIITSRNNHCKIGKGVTIGHLAQIHSATVGDFSLIGMGSVIDEGCVVESEAMVAAGAVVSPGTVIPSGELWIGNPARRARALSPVEREKLHYQSSEYVNVADGHRQVMRLGGNLFQEAVTAGNDDTDGSESCESEQEEILEETVSSAAEIEFSDQTKSTVKSTTRKGKKMKVAHDEDDD